MEAVKSRRPTLLRGTYNSYNPDESGQIAVGLLIIVLLCGGIAWFVYGKLNTYQVDVRVQSLTWSRKMNIEKFQTVEEDSIRLAVPADAFNIRDYTRTWTTEDSYECGTSKRPKTCTSTHHHSEYRAKYNVNRWRYSHTLETHGGPKDEREWPMFEPSKVEEIGALREQWRGEEFYVTFKCESIPGDITRSLASYQEWKSYSVETGYTIAMNRFQEPQWNTLKAR